MYTCEIYTAQPIAHESTTAISLQYCSDNAAEYKHTHTYMRTLEPNNHTCNDTTTCNNTIASMPLKIENATRL